jgi:hypothetical protein
MHITAHPLITAILRYLWCTWDSVKIPSKSLNQRHPLMGAIYGSRTRTRYNTTAQIDSSKTQDISTIFWYCRSTGICPRLCPVAQLLHTVGTCTLLPRAHVLQNQCYSTSVTVILPGTTVRPYSYFGVVVVNGDPFRKCVKNQSKQLYSHCHCI